MPARRCARPRCSTRPSRRADDRAGRLFRPGDHRHARGLPALPRARRRRQAGVPPRHPRRPLCRGARPRALLRRARAPRAARRSAATAPRQELRYLVGTGVTAAAIWHLRQRLDGAGFAKVKIVASSGFGPAKCRMMAGAKAPIDVVGTGSYLPEIWTETYATADIVAYDGEPRGQGRPRVPAAEADRRLGRSSKTVRPLVCRHQLFCRPPRLSPKAAAGLNLRGTHDRPPLHRHRPAQPDRGRHRRQYRQAPPRARRGGGAGRRSRRRHRALRLPAIRPRISC